MEQIIILAKSFSHLLLSLPFSLSGATRYTENDVKAYWQPPGYVFGIVWPVLYLIFGLINLRVEFSTKYNETFKRLVFHQSIQESLLQALWLLVTAKDGDKPRYKFQYILGFVIMLYLVNYAFMYRSKTFSRYTELNFLYIPYKIWISFALILSFQQLIRSIYLRVK